MFLQNELEPVLQEADPLKRQKKLYQFLEWYALATEYDVLQELIESFSRGEKMFFVDKFFYHEKVSKVLDEVNKLWDAYQADTVKGDLD